MELLSFSGACEYAWQGKKIRQINGNGNIVEANTGGLLVWACSGLPVHVSKKLLDYCWEVVEDPPKKYPFAEAYQMMKAERWMRPQGSLYPYRWNPYYACWQIKNADNTATRIDSLPFTCIEAQWEEVP